MALAMMAAGPMAHAQAPSSDADSSHLTQGVPAGRAPAQLTAQQSAALKADIRRLRQQIPQLSSGVEKAIPLASVLRASA